MQDLQQQLAALTQRQAATDAEAVVSQAINDGKLLPAQRDWALGLGKKDLASLNAYVATAPKIAALSGNQTGGATPPGGAASTSGDAALTAISQMFGNDPAAVAEAMKC